MKANKLTKKQLYAALVKLVKYHRAEVDVIIQKAGLTYEPGIRQEILVKWIIGKIADGNQFLAAELHKLAKQYDYYSLTGDFDEQFPLDGETETATASNGINPKIKRGYLMSAGVLAPAFAAVLIHRMYHKDIKFGASDMLIFAGVSIVAGFFTAKLLKE